MKRVPAARVWAVANVASGPNQQTVSLSRIKGRSSRWSVNSVNFRPCQPCSRRNARTRSRFRGPEFSGAAAWLSCFATPAHAGTPTAGRGPPRIRRAAAVASTASIRSLAIIASKGRRFSAPRAAGEPGNASQGLRADVRRPIATPTASATAPCRGSGGPACATPTVVARTVTTMHAAAIQAPAIGRQSGTAPIAESCWRPAGSSSSRSKIRMGAVSAIRIERPGKARQSVS